MIKKAKKSIVQIGGIVLLVCAVLFLFVKNEKQSFPEELQSNTRMLREGRWVTLRGASEDILAQVLDTPELRTKGLSGTLFLPVYEGRWFVFDEAGMYGFWMKDMNFPIDIVWVDDTFRVVGVSENLTPDSYPRVFYPPSPVRYVLEMNAGEVLRLGITQGMQFLIQQE